MRSDARKVSRIELIDVWQVFERHGEATLAGRRFDSQRKLIDALIAQKLATGNNDGTQIAHNIATWWGFPAGKELPKGKYITIGEGPRKAKVMTWEGGPPSES